MMKNGIVLVRFESVTGRDDVIYGGIFYFDKKSVVKVWFLDLEFLKSKFNSVSVWVKFYGFDVMYWNVTGISKIGSLMGRFMFTDMNIYRKVSINFVRVLIDAEIGYELKDIVCFKNEKGIIVDQIVDYEWRYV